METKIKRIPELFGRAVLIEEPWYISSIEMVSDEVHMYIDVIQQQPSNHFGCSVRFYCLSLTTSFAENSKLNPQFPRDKR